DDEVPPLRRAPGRGPARRRGLLARTPGTRKPPRRAVYRCYRQLGRRPLALVRALARSRSSQLESETLAPPLAGEFLRHRSREPIAERVCRPPRAVAVRRELGALPRLARDIEAVGVATAAQRHVRPLLRQPVGREHERLRARHALRSVAGDRVP